MLLDIVILPPKVLRQRIGKKIKDATKDVKAVFVVNNKKLILHLSLFHIRTSKARLSRLSGIVKGIVKKHKVMNMRSAGLEISKSGSGIVYVNVSYPLKLVRLREEVFNSCYPLRTGPMPWMIKSRPPTRQEKLARKKFGTYLKFHPHFTLAMFQNHRDAERVIERMGRIKFDFTADTVAVTEVNSWHQVTGIIKKFKLKRSRIGFPIRSGMTKRQHA
ncbi:MAG: 2'-5' RNA ligase family protein [Candidatus Doudnabacteria bacterium]|nr:2'-5' RNA ligase family protein [Candidatus Doudnabacteria bacterium]